MKRRIKMKKSKPIDRSHFCYEEEVEEIGLCDFVPSEPIAQFTFDNNFVPSNEPMIKVESAKVSPEVLLTSSSLSNLPDNRTLKSKVNGITPPIDGENFEIKRGFTFRRSTIRLLNELKAADPNVNVYLSTLVDKALRHYHEYIFKEKYPQNQNIFR